MDYRSSKEKLPEGLSYPVGRSVLDTALATAGVEAVDEVDMLPFRTLASEAHDSLTPVMCVEFDGEETARPWKGPGAITIRMYAVPSGIKHAVAAALNDGALAELAGWVASIPSRAETWRMVDHRYQLDVDLESPAHLHVMQS